MAVYKKLQQVQSELICPKQRKNNFGGYSFRNVEDILSATKPLMEKYKCLILLSDEIVALEGRFYIKSTATFIDVETTETIKATAFARESLQIKGMAESQITGATTSYSRKCALNGLLAIDDTVDMDSINKHGKSISDKQVDRLLAIALSKSYTETKIRAMIRKKYDKELEDLEKEEYDNVCEGLEKIGGTK